MAPTIVPTIKIAGFAPIPLYILLDPHLSPEAKLTYLIIRHHDRGHGCFACRETLAIEIGLSPYHIRKGICELLDRGIITLEKRHMGLTDLIRLVDHDWGLPSNVPADELTEPEFVIPPEPEFPEDPRLPVQPVEIEVDFAKEPAEVEIEPVEEPIVVEAAEEPAEDTDKPVEPGRENVSDRSSNDLNYKYDAFKDDVSKHIHTPSTKLGRKEETDQTNQEREWEKLVRSFYQVKEGRTPTRNELLNWKPTATRLLSEFTLSELISATQYAIAKGARLFYYVALVGPAYILQQRQQKQEDVERQKHASKALSEERQRQHQLEALRSSAREYEAQRQELLTDLEERMRPQTFRVWFKDAFVTNITEDSLTLAVPSQGAVDWISKSYAALLQEVSGKTNIRLIAAS